MIENLVPALALTILAGLATGVGSLVSYFVPRPDMRYLSVSLGFATGVMIFVASSTSSAAPAEAIGMVRADLSSSWRGCSSSTLDKVVPIPT